MTRSIGPSIERPRPRLAQVTTSPLSREADAVGPQLTAHERRDLEKRRAALQTDPVARGTGSVLLILVSVVASIAITAWAINKYGNNDDTTTTPSMGRR